MILRWRNADRPERRSRPEKKSHIAFKSMSRCADWGSMVSVLPLSHRTDSLQVDAESLRFSPVCIECERPSTLSVRRWGGLTVGFVPVRMCDAHAGRIHVRSALLTSAAVSGLTVMCVGELTGSSALTLAGLLSLVAVLVAAPYCMRSRLHAGSDGVVVKGASIAFAHNNESGIAKSREDILDGWFTVQHFDMDSRDDGSETFPGHGAMSEPS